MVWECLSPYKLYTIITIYDNNDLTSISFDQGPDTALMLKLISRDKALCRYSPDGDAIIDSGCSTTAVNDISVLAAWKQRSQAVNTAGTQQLNIKASGPVGPFKDVFCIPELENHLISVKDLNDIGVVVHIDGGRLVMTYNDTEIFCIISTAKIWKVDFRELCDKILALMPQAKRNTMWWLQETASAVTTRSASTQAVSKGQPKDQAVSKGQPLVSDHVASKGQPTNLVTLWHLRLNHRHEAGIVKDANDGLLSLGRTRLHSSDVPTSRCPSCQIAKSHRAHRPSHPIEKATITVSKRVRNEAFDPKDQKQQGFSSGTVSTDTCGPYTVPSIHKGYVGNHNFLMMDSKYVFIYGYKNKDEVTTVANLRKLVDHDLKLQGLELTRYHSDGAGELSGDAVKRYLNSIAVAQTTSTAYSPQENSYIERHFRSEQEATVAMMAHARFLPKSLWFYAKEAYTYVYNRTPTVTGKGRMSPSQHITGVTPDLSHIKVWGCKAWVNIPLEKRHKDFQPRARTGYLVGYSEVFRGAYKVWIPEWNQVIISRDVTFDEMIPQGDIDHATNPYWLEVRRYAHRVDGIPRDIEDFQYLIGNVFYDPEHMKHYRVTSIEVERGQIVAGYSNWSTVEGAIQNDTKVDRMHVANVEELLNGSGIETVSVLLKENTSVSAPKPDGDALRKRNPITVESNLSEHPSDTKGRLSVAVASGETDVEDELQYRTTELSGGQFSRPTQYINPTTVIDLPFSGTRDAEVAYAAVAEYLNMEAEPKTYKEAISGPESKAWRVAIAAELRSMETKEVLKLVPLTRELASSVKVIGARFIFKKKVKHGQLHKYKCRLVAKGYTQREGIDYAETYAPVARMNTIRVFLKVSVDRGHVRISVDYVTAFLNGELNEELYLESIEGMDCPQGYIYRLMKAIYGLKQAGRSWNVLISDYLKTYGFKQCVSDHCVFVKDNGNLMVLVYVDDLIISALVKSDADDLIADMEKVFEIGDKGPIDWYVGVAFKDDGDKLFLSQADYVQSMLKKYDFDCTLRESTPMKEKWAVVKDPEDILYPEFNLKSKVGSLMYLTVCTRPDIAFAVSAIARMSNHPNKEVCKAVNHVFAYLAGTPEYGINMKREPDSQLSCYSDSDYAGDVNDQKSTTGVTVFIGSTLVSWYSSKQTTTAQSSTDAEGIAMNFATKEVVWLRGLLEELGIPQTYPTKMYGDNQAAIMLVTNPVFHKRTKHIMVKIAYLQEMSQAEQTLWFYIHTLKNCADGLTKPQKLALFIVFVHFLNMLPHV